MRAFDRWRALSRGQRRLTMQACIAVGAAVVALRVFGVGRTLRLATLDERGPEKADTKNVIASLVTAVERAGRYVPRATCLSKSIGLAWMLRGTGVAVAVRIGVKTAGHFEAHAWVEAEGAALTTPDGVTDRFTVIL